MKLLAPGTISKFTLLLIVSAAFTLAAQTPARFRSTEIHPDHSVTFYYRDATGTKVTLSLDGVAKPIPMEKDAAGVWSVTTQPLAPEVYSYHFEADGNRRFDPTNPRVSVNLLSVANLFTLPGDTPQPWEETNVPTWHRPPSHLHDCHGPRLTR